MTVQRYEVRGSELGGDARYEDWVEVVRAVDYEKLEQRIANYEYAVTLLAKAWERDRRKVVASLIDDLMGYAE